MLEINTTHWPFVRWRSDAINPRAVAWIFLWISILAASTYNAYAKVLTNALSPLSLVLISEMLTALFIILSFGFVPIAKKIVALPRKNFLPLLSIALCTGTMGPALWFIGLHKTSAINATLFGNADMVFLIMLAVVFLKEKWNSAHVIAAATITLGMVFIALKGFTEGFSFQQGDIFFVFASLSFSTGSIVFCKFLHKTDPHIVIFIRSVLTVCLLLVVLGFTGNPLLPELLSFPSELIVVLLGFALISRFLNAFSYYEALDRMPVSTVSIVSNFSQVTAIAFSALYLGEMIYWYQIAGGIVIVTGIVFLEMHVPHPRSKHLKPHLKQGHFHR